MSRQSNYYEQAIELCEKEIDEKIKYIKDVEVRLANMKKFDSSKLGKAIRKFCKEYAKENYNEKLLKEIEEMIKSPELNPYEFDIDYDEPCKGEKLLYGKKFTTSHKKFGYPDCWFMFYHWNNYDLDNDIEKMEKSIKTSKRKIQRARIRLYNATVGLKKFKDIIYSSDDISNMKEILNTAKSVTITNSDKGNTNTFNTIAIIQECMTEGIPVTIKYSLFPEQEIDIKDTKFTVEDSWEYYQRCMRYEDYEMKYFNRTYYY